MTSNLFKFTFTLLVLVLIAVVNAAPAPGANVTDTELVPRRALAAQAWEHSGFRGARYDLSDHGTDCVRLVKSWDNRWSSIKVLDGYRCIIYQNIWCSTAINVDSAFLKFTGPKSFSSFPPAYNDRISSYKCHAV